MTLRQAISRTAILALGFVTQAAFAQHEPASGAPEQITLDAQGGGGRQWADNPHLHDFYELTVETLRKPRRNFDLEAYEQASYAIFRELGKSVGADPEGMADHLKGIPAELVTIVERDPATLDSYENFLVALMGPR